MFILAKSADPDETPRFVAFHLGRRCLFMFPNANFYFRLATHLMAKIWPVKYIQAPGAVGGCCPSLSVVHASYICICVFLLSLCVSRVQVWCCDVLLDILSSLKINSLKTSLLLCWRLFCLSSSVTFSCCDRSVYYRILGRT